MAASLNPVATEAGRCACCKRSLAEGLWIEAEGQSLCEGCFLADRKAREGLVPASEVAATLGEALAEALDLREHETGLHSRRVACHTLVVARRVRPEPKWLQQVYWGSLLHDVGKIGVSDAVLLKRGRLDEREWQEMRTHPRKGFEILSRVPEFGDAAQVAYCHEERFDGSGYPRGLAGEQIPLASRLFSVIDALDAMTSDRPYRRAASFDIARDEIVGMTGKQFDPVAVQAFVAAEATLRQMVALKCTTPQSKGVLP